MHSSCLLQASYCRTSNAPFNCSRMGSKARTRCPPTSQPSLLWYSMQVLPACAHKATHSASVRLRLDRTRSLQKGMHQQHIWLAATWHAAYWAVRALQQLSSAEPAQLNNNAPLSLARVHLDKHAQLHLPTERVTKCSFWRMALSYVVLSLHSTSQMMGANSLSCSCSGRQTAPHPLIGCSINRQYKCVAGACSASHLTRLQPEALHGMHHLGPPLAVPQGVLGQCSQEGVKRACMRKSLPDGGILSYLRLQP